MGVLLGSGCLTSYPVVLLIPENKSKRSIFRCNAWSPSHVHTVLAPTRSNDPGRSRLSGRPIRWVSDLEFQQIHGQELGLGLAPCEFGVRWLRPQQARRRKRRAPGGGGSEGWFQCDMSICSVHEAWVNQGSWFDPPCRHRKHEHERDLRSKT